MYYGKINKNDVANGIGVRVSLFVSGCRIHCKECFNQDTWNFLFGKEFTKIEENQIIDALGSEYIDGLTILGGEVFEPENQEAIYPFVKRIREIYPNKTIWMYSGYILDKDILPLNGKVHTKYSKDIISLIDILVDGPFVVSKKNLSLNFRGSSNQRIIDIKKTLANNEIVLSELNN